MRACVSACVQAGVRAGVRADGRYARTHTREYVHISLRDILTSHETHDDCRQLAALSSEIRLVLQGIWSLWSRQQLVALLPDAAGRPKQGRPAWCCRALEGGHNCHLNQPRIQRSSSNQDCRS